MAGHSITCTYCNSLNSLNEKTCVGCGAPLPEKRHSVSGTPHRKKLSEFKPRPVVQPRKIPSQDLQKAQTVGKDIDKIATKGIYIYAIFWRTLAESVVIAITALSLGIFGGATDMAVWGILCGVAIGVCVGLAIKNYYLVLLSAPLGAVIGTTIGGMLWAVGTGPKVLVFSTTILASLFALLGSRSYPYALRNKWEKTRPYLGGLGGLIFAVLGTLIGIQIRNILNPYIGL